MTPEQIDRVTNSLNELEPHLGDVGAILYAKLFEIAPDTRQLFGTDIASQERKLMLLLKEFIKARSRSLHFMPIKDHGGHAVIPGIETLKNNHARYGVTPAHFDHMREALNHALQTVMGERFTPELASAWAAAFDMLAEAMQEPALAASSKDGLGAIFGQRMLQADTAMEHSIDDFFKK